MSYEVRLEQYSGPLQKLLEMIEEKKLEITTVNLSLVTADFIAHTKSLGEKADSKILSDFLIIASRLVLIKSKVLLPSIRLSDEEEGQIRDLEERLKIYQEYKSAAQAFKNSWKTRRASFARTFFQNMPPFFYPSAKLSAQILLASIQNAFKTLEQIAPKDERILKRAIVSIEEKMNELIARFARSATYSFREVSSGKPKEEIVVLFLAILHLLKHQKIMIEHENNFDDIIIRT